MNSCLFSSLLLISTSSIFTLGEGSLLIFRVEYVAQLYRSRISSATRFPADPLERYTLKQRQKLCDEVIIAEVFEYVRLTATEIIPDPATDNTILENIQRTAPTPDDPDPILLHYTNENPPVKSLGCPDNVKMLPCVHTENVKWYVTFGFRKGQLFLIEEMKTVTSKRKYLRMTALIEPNSSFDFETWRPSDVQHWLRYIQSKRMEKIASNTIMEYYDVPDDMKLKKPAYTMSQQRYVRLCGSILETLSSPRIRFFGHNITKSVNYVRNRLRGPKNKPNQGLFRVKAVDEEWARIKGDVFITCSVARYVFSVLKEDQFFLLANPETLGSVFVFREVPASLNELEFLALVYNVPTLKYYDDLGKSDTVAVAGPSNTM